MIGIQKTRWPLLAVALLTACGGSKPLSRPDEASSVIEFTRMLEAHMAKLLDAPLNEIRRAVVKPEVLPDYTRYEGLISGNWRDAKPVAGVATQYEKYCRKLNGQYKEPFCRLTSDPDNVPFVAKLTLEQFDNVIVRVVILEPKDDRMSEPYVRELRKLGYRPHAEISSEQASNAAKTRRLADERERNLPLVRRVGAKVCRISESPSSKASTVYMGYVERVEESKIQIRVTRAVIEQLPGYAPPGFQPEIIWDYPTNWLLCE